MLVISRKPDERIIFPSLGISIQILKLSKSAAKVGIAAPPDVQILRHELEPQRDASALDRPTIKKMDHALANALSKVTLGIHLARKQWQAGRMDAADTTLANALQALDVLEQDRRSAGPAPCRALIVEDDANERELLVGILGMNGCECSAAADGEAALEHLASHERPDVVLLDMGMPRCDGRETLRRIRSDERLAGLRVFSVSTTSPEELNIPQGPMGFDGWFPKPLNPNRLWTAIQTSMRSHASTH